MRRPPKRLHRRPAPGIDFAAVSRIADLVAIIAVDGESTPVVSPIADPGDHSDFDRNLCGLGVKAFVRARMGSDWPAGLASPGHVLVKEMAPGIRHRVPIVVAWDHEMN